MTRSVMELAKQANKTKSVQRVAVDDTSHENRDIAIIGMAGSIGDADELEGFFSKVLNKYNFVRDLPKNRKTQADQVFKAMYPDSDVSSIRYVRGGYLNSIDMFDYDFFGIPFIEAETMDPVQRAIFQTTIKALWDAGYKEKQLDNTQTGVFVGNSNTSTESYKGYLMKCDESLKNVSLAGNLNSVLSSRISYYLNLKGTSVVVDTACSSGLAALHFACEELKRGDCNLAIVAGAKMNLLPPIVQKETLGICSEDGYTRTFDSKSKGTGIGEGVISLILKPLPKAKEDRDNVYAVIKGTALNQDGKSVGITAPNAQSQEELLRTAWKNSNVNPERIQYIEAHGTATKLGDVVEIEAITKAFRTYTGKRQFCAISSVKSNVGHTDAISGLVGLVKCVYAIRQQKIPASLHFESPNKSINFIESPVYVNDQSRDWEVGQDEKRTCCVSSFGLSGTNVCVVLQEYNSPVAEEEKEHSHSAWISAKSTMMLEKMLRMYLSYVKDTPELNLADFAYTLNCRRNQYKYAVSISFSKYEELLSGLRELIDSFENGQAVYEVDKEWKFDVNSNGSGKCISLPSHPFEEKHCFILPKKAVEKEKIQRNKSQNDLVPFSLFNAIRENVFEIEMSTQNQWELGEHSVDDKYLLVGTSYLEIVSQIARNYYDINNAHIYDMMLMSGLVASDDQPIKLQIYVQKEKDAFRFEMYSNQKDQSIFHCKGCFDGKPQESSGAYDVKEILDQVDSTKIITPEIYLYGQIRISDRWHVTNKIYFGTTYHVAQISIPDKYQQEAEDYILYPTVMDAALNFCNTVLGEGTYLPWQYGNVSVYGSLPNEIYSFVRIPENLGNKEVLKFNVDLVDKDGHVVASVHDYTVKRTVFEKASLKQELCISKREWVELENVEYAEEPRKSVILSCKSRELPVDIEEYQRVVFDCSLSAENEDFEVRYEDTYLNFIKLMKELLNRHPSGLQEILVINNHGYSIHSEPTINYFGAALAAGMKSLRYEYPSYAFRHVDFDESEKESLWKNLDVNTDAVSLVYRNGKYYREEICLFNERPTISDFSIRKEGVYIVTGGLGGVGLTIADALSEAGATKVALLGRTKYSDLDSIGNAPYTDSMSKLELLHRIKERGTEIEYISMNVSDRISTYSVLETLVQRYGTINGIVHAAGIAGEGLFFQKSMEDLRTVLDCKILGLHYIDSFISEKNLSPDFLMVCSSFTALAGAIGQWDYAVANEFLNVYCNHKNRKQGCRYISAVWPTWDESGMAHRHGFKKEECIFLPISNEAGKEYFRELIVSEGGESILGQWNTELLSGENLKMNILFHHKKTVKTGSVLENTGGKPQFDDTCDVDPKTIKADLLRLWIRVLGRDDIDEDDKFFEMEGNSILATYLLSEINQVYGDIIDITDIFTHSSINMMTDLIYKRISKNKKKKVEDDDLDSLLQSLIDGKVTVDEIKMKI